MKVFILASHTADGLIARSSHHLTDYTSREDKKLFVQLTKAAGVIIMGANQFGTINRILPGRRMIVYTRHPEKITAEGVETTSESPKALVARLKSEGATGVAICGGGQIYTMFMKSGVVTELYLTISPLLFGTGLTLFSESLDIRLKLLETYRLGTDEILIKYAVLQPADTP